jgi:hypothetical protein
MITDYKQLSHWRTAVPAVILSWHASAARAVQEITLADYLKRATTRIEAAEARETIDWCAVAASVAADNRAVIELFAQYPEPDWHFDRDAGEDRCRICDDGDICAEAFACDVRDVWDDLNRRNPYVPYIAVLRWMHDNGLHSNVDGISAIAARYRQEQEQTA